MESDFKMANQNYAASDSLLQLVDEMLEVRNSKENEVKMYHQSNNKILH